MCFSICHLNPPPKVKWRWHFIDQKTMQQRGNNLPKVQYLLLNLGFTLRFSDFKSRTASVLASVKEIKIACPSCMISWLRHEQLNLWFASSGCGMQATIKGSPA